MEYFTEKKKQLHVFPYILRNTIFTYRLSVEHNTIRSTNGKLSSTSNDGSIAIENQIQDTNNDE